MLQACFLYFHFQCQSSKVRFRPYLDVLSLADDNVQNTVLPTLNQIVVVCSLLPVMDRQKIREGDLADRLAIRQTSTFLLQDLVMEIL